MSEQEYTPASIIRYPEMGVLLKILLKYDFLDPFLRQFLNKLCHCKLIFKRYRLNINDMLNFRQRCILCNNAIDTPKHLFERCERGISLREKRDLLIRNVNFNNTNITENKKIYSYFSKSYNDNKLLQYIITASNYSIYKVKMKLFYDPSYVVTNEAATYIFVKIIKQRIFCDHRRLCFEKFKEIWDPNNSRVLFEFNRTKIDT